jgi:O-acetylserine/cysteine efflux transporter
MSTTFSSKDLSLTALVVIVWGLNFTVMKVGLREFTPFQLGAARFFCAAFPLVLFIKRPPMHMKWLIYFSLGQALGQFGFMFTALKLGMTAALASVLMQTQVFFTALFAYLILHERLTRTQLVGLALSVLGLLCFAMHLIAGYAVTAPAITAFGFIFTLCAAASWASSNIVARKMREHAGDYDPLAFAIWTSVVPVLPFAAMSALFDAPTAHANWLNATFSGWLAVAYLGWVATVFAYAVWTGLLKRHSPNRVAPFGLGVPVVGIAAGMWLLGEQVSGWQWAGIALIGAALVVTTALPNWGAAKISSAQR